MILSGVHKPIQARYGMQMKVKSHSIRSWRRSRLFPVVQCTAHKAMETQSTVRTIRITKPVEQAIQDHARREHPAECCGLLSGSNGLITDIHQLRNDADKPETRYFATPEELFAAMRRIRESGQALLGVYHSHPRTPAYPSQSDVEMAFYPEAYYFIISLEPSVELKAFKIEDFRIEDVEIVRSP
jgi:[CysO sulfur-carrier protein]-S-L-cysteine hydrolase